MHSQILLRAVVAVAALLAAVGVTTPVALHLRDRAGPGETLVLSAEAPPVGIYLPANPDARLVQAAQDLRRVIETMTGAQARIRLRPGYAGGRGFYLGAFPQAAGYRWQSAGGAVRIGGTHPSAATYAFLREEAGVRWYAPGPEGEVIPQGRKWELGVLDAGREPFFTSTLIGGGRGPEYKTWLLRQGVRRNDRFHHNLHRIITPADYNEHPDWFPRKGGEYVRPAGDPKLAYQPALEHPGVVARTVEKAHQYFSRHPDADGFSIGLNDNLAFGDQLAESPHFAPDRFLRGRPDASDYVFAYTNKVAAALAKDYPDKRLGALAYYWWLNTPSFPLHPNVLPYVCEDRSQWYDPAMRAEGLKLLEGWAGSGVKSIGLYDYYYGMGFVIPRMHTGTIIRTFQECARLNVSGIYIELYPNWPFDAPKAWLAARLCEDPAADAAALLEDFYNGYYGSAAPRMRDFFEQCERIWMNQPGTGRWLKHWRSSSQLTLFPPDACARLAEILDDAHAAADTVPAKARIGKTREAFALTSAASRHYGLKREIAALDKQAPEEAIASKLAELAALEKHLHELGAPAYLLADAPSMRFAPMITRPLETYLGNMDFEKSEWAINDRPAENAVIIPDPEAAHSGETGLAISGTDAATLHATSYAKPGLGYRLSVMARGKVGPGCQTSISIEWLDAEGENIGSSRQAPLYPGEHEQWQELVVAASAPERAAYLNAVINIRHQENAPGAPDWLHLDAVTLAPAMFPGTPRTGGPATPN